MALLTTVDWVAEQIMNKLLHICQINLVSNIHQTRTITPYSCILAVSQNCRQRHALAAHKHTTTTKRVDISTHPIYIWDNDERWDRVFCTVYSNRFLIAIYRLDLSLHKARRISQPVLVVYFFKHTLVWIWHTFF